MHNKSNGENVSEEVVLIDHTGARHWGKKYDAMKALRDAETARPLLDSRSQMPGDLRSNWSETIRERE